VPNLAEKLKDRFKPGIFDRLKQSREARQQTRNRKTEQKKIPDVVEQPRRILDTQTSIFGNQGVLHTQQIWNGWNTQLTASTSCVTNDVWGVWHQNTGTGGLISSATTWNQWTNQIITITAPTYATTTQIWNDWQTMPQPMYGRPTNHFTPEELARRRAEEERYRAEEAARTARWHEDERVRRLKTDEAEATAMKLLVSMLSDQQRSDLKTHKHFFVDAPSGRLYRIDYGTHGNVKVVDRNTRKIIERLCIQPNGVPAGDANLMQKLLIETAEETFRAHANITLEDGRILYGKTENLTGDKLAEVIPIRRAA